MKNFKYKNSYESKRPKCQGRSRTRPSQVIPIKEMLARFARGREVKVDNSRTGGFHEDTLNEVEDAVMIHRSDVAAKAIQYSKEAERASKEFNKEVAQKKRKKLDEIQSKVEENRARKESDKDENIDKRDNSREGGIDQ